MSNLSNPNQDIFTTKTKTLTEGEDLSPLYDQLPPQDLYILWAAMWAGIGDGDGSVHSAVNQLTREQWDRAELLLAHLDKLTNLKFPVSE